MESMWPQSNVTLECMDRADAESFTSTVAEACQEDVQDDMHVSNATYAVN